MAEPEHQHKQARKHTVIVITAVDVLHIFVTLIVVEAGLLGQVFDGFLQSFEAFANRGVLREWAGVELRLC